MAIGDQYRQIQPDDRWIEDANGNIVGVQNPRAKFGSETRWLTEATKNAVDSLVSGAWKRGASVLRAGKPWLRLPAAAGQVGTGAGVSHGGGASGAFTTRRGRPCYEITIPANANLQSMFFAIQSGTVTNRQHIVFEVEDAEQWRGGSWRLGFYTDSGFATGVRATITADSYNGYNGMHCLAPLATEWANVGAGSFASTMTQCIFQFQRKTGASGSTRIWVYEIAEAEKSSLPQIVIGVGMLKLLQIYVAIPAFLGLVGIHVVVILPFVIALLTTSVQALDRAQEEAADSLGAGPVRRFLLVTLPALAPGLFAAGVIGFLMSFGEVTVTSFLTTARMTTLPVRIYSEATTLEPTAHAISALLIVATVLTLWLVGRVVRLDKLYAR